MADLALPLVAVLAVVASALADRRRTALGLRLALRRFVAIVPPFLVMLVLASVALAVVSPERISSLVAGENLVVSSIVGALLGSIALMPGFIAYPLAGILLQQGVPYTVLAALTAALMLVGIATFPIERAYFGTSVALVRNGTCFAIALCVALGVGLYYGELW